MYKAVFKISGQEATNVSGIAYVAFNSAFIGLLIEGVEGEANLAGMTVVLGSQVIDTLGSALPAKMVWSSEVGGFFLHCSGKKVGVILLDELKAAIMVQPIVGRRSTACEVMFNASGLAVWRKGLLDQSTGTVIALTQNESLSYLPATVFVTALSAGDSQSREGVIHSLDLSPGQVDKAFALTLQQLNWLKTQAGSTMNEPEGSESTFDGLLELGEAVKTFLTNDMSMNH
ncbi:hypothetical protein LCGC14_0328200 [marine sediment metagenome]|uniref:Uncharacterized protein n=1 Tax=marine sediment metagenome TaxID=412755 RepID=A0A0F9W4L6_9ZZZZ